MANNTHRVLRQFTGAGQVRNPGDLVDGSEFVSLKALEDQRYVERLDTDNPVLGGAGPSPDPKLIQEAAARSGRSKNSQSGGIAAMTEVEGTLGAKENNTAAPQTDESQTPPRGKLPADFPGHAALEAAGITTYGQLRKVSDLTTITGIGEATASKIEEAMAGRSDEDRAADEEEGKA